MMYLSLYMGKIGFLKKALVVIVLSVLASFFVSSVVFAVSDPGPDAFDVSEDEAAAAEAELERLRAMTAEERETYFAEKRAEITDPAQQAVLDAARARIEDEIPPASGDAGGDAPAEGAPAGDAPSPSDDEDLPGGSDGTSGGTVLPATDFEVSECLLIMREVNWGATGPESENRGGVYIRKAFASRDNVVIPKIDGEVSINDVLACGIKTGDIKLWMVPYYIRFILETIISLAGLVSVGAFIYGGYVYLFAGLSDDKEKGKKAVLYSVIGFILTMVAWALVNIVISLVT